MDFKKMNLKEKNFNKIIYMTAPKEALFSFPAANIRRKNIHWKTSFLEEKLYSSCPREASTLILSSSNKLRKKSCRSSETNSQTTRLVENHQKKRMSPLTELRSMMKKAMMKDTRIHEEESSQYFKQHHSNLIKGSKEENMQVASVLSGNLRIRQDTARYLLNLDVNSAYYDPKSRSIHEDPLPNSDSNEKFKECDWQVIREFIRRRR